MWLVFDVAGCALRLVVEASKGLQSACDVFCRHADGIERRIQPGNPVTPRFAVCVTRLVVFFFIGRTWFNGLTLFRFRDLRQP